MDVSCPQCETLYEFDDRQVQARDGVTLQCSQCDHLFRLKTDSGPQDERQRRWMVRAAESGDILYFSTFQTLHEWIMEGRVAEEDSISRTGKTWKQLKEMGEFAPIFQVVASIAGLRGGDDGGEDKAGKEGREQSEDLRSVEKSTPPGNDRRRTSTDKQFGAKRGPQPTPVPDRSEQRTPAVGGRAPTATAQRRAQNSHHTPGPTERDDQGKRPSRRRAARSPKSTPAPRVEDERLRGRADSRDTDDTGDWTLGELENVEAEHAGVEDGEIDLSSVRRRRWPGVVITLLIVSVAVGLWQREALEEGLESTGLWTTDAEDGQVDRDDDSPLSEAVTEASQTLHRGLEEAHAQRRRLEMSELRPEVREVVEEARIAAVEEAGDAGQPTVEDLLSAGRRSLDRGNIRQAIDQFQQVLDESPNHPQALLGLGQARLGTGQHERAIQKFEAVRRTDPSVGEALIGIGTARRALGQNQRALEAYEKYLREFPDGSQASIAEFQRQDLTSP